MVPGLENSDLVESTEPTADQHGEGGPSPKRARVDSENVVEESRKNLNETNPAAEETLHDKELVGVDGDVEFRIITNDGEVEHLVQLINLKNIFSKQLPKMPKEYIVRLVFDRRHKSLVIVKKGTKAVIGGICYRPYQPQAFAEIAFCAITATEQVKGFGTKLMSQLKEAVKKEGISHFLTYADNYAIGYFKKQGFSKTVTMERDRWVGYIKDYDGGTLMECSISSLLDYTSISSMIEKQREFIYEKIRANTKSNIIYNPVPELAQGKKLTDPYKEIPGVRYAGWTAPPPKSTRGREEGSLKSQLYSIFRQVKSHSAAWPFHEPVDTSVVLDYLDIIKDPIDLSLVDKRLSSGEYYKSKSMFKADLIRMCTNCTTYNAPDTTYYRAGQELKAFVEQKLPDEES